MQSSARIWIAKVGTSSPVTPGPFQLRHCGNELPRFARIYRARRTVHVRFIWPKQRQNGSGRTGTLDTVNDCFFILPRYGMTKHHEVKTIGMRLANLHRGHEAVDRKNVESELFKQQLASPQEHLVVRYRKHFCHD